METDIIKYLEGVSTKPLPARFYRADNLLPYVSPSLSLIENYEAVHGFLSNEEIIQAYVILSGEKNATTIVSTIKGFGDYLHKRYNIDDNYKSYNREQYQVDLIQWESSTRKEKNYERLLVDRMHEINSRIMSYPNAPIARKEIEESNVVFDISWVASSIAMTDLPNRDFNIQPIVDDGRITQEDSVDIFSLLRITKDVDYIAFHTPTSNQYKLTGAQGGHRPSKDEYTYRSIVDGELYTDLKSSPGFIAFIIDGYFSIIDLYKSKITFYSLKETNVNNIISVARNYLYFLRLRDERRQRISTSFLLLRHAVNYPIFYADVLLNENEYIYFKEEDTPQLMKNIKIFYVSPIPIVISPETGMYKKINEFKISLTNHIATNTELVNMLDGRTEQIMKGEFYTELSVAEVNNFSLLSFVGMLFVKIFGKYINVTEPEYKAALMEDFRELLTITEAARESYAKKTENVKNIDYLHHIAPQLFVKNYSRVCQQYQQPDIKDFLDEEDEKSGHWLPFPPQQKPELYFKCEQHRGRTDGKPPYPYPGVIENKKLKNQKQYPLIPCCFMTDPMVPGKVTYKAYHKPKESEFISSINSESFSSRWGSLEYPPKNNRTIMTEDKTLYRGRLGVLPQILEAVLKDVISGVVGEDEVESVQILRYGLSEQTLVHAVFLAMDTEYQKLTMLPFEDRDRYIRDRIRLDHVDLLRQEIAFPNKEKILEDPHQWTTREHYRILEEMFNVNIFVLYRTSAKEGLDEPTKYTFEIPNSRTGYHVRHKRTDRPYIILYKHSKYDGDIKIETPLEMIIYGRSEGDFSAVWGTACSEIYTIYDKSYNVVSCGFSPIEMTSSAYGRYEHVYSQNYADILKIFKPSSQVIDEFGHARALNFASLNFSAIFYPTQPFNLPLGPLIKTDINNAERLLGKSKYISAQRDGLFYLIGQNGLYIFVPITRKQLEDDSMLKVAFTPLSGEQRGNTVKNTWGRAYSYLKIILFIFSWLYTLSDLTPPQRFMDKHVILDESKHASIVSDIYDFFGLKRMIVLRRANIDEAIKYLERVAPSVFGEKGKILITSKGLYDGFLYFLKIVDKQVELSRKNNSGPFSQVRWDISRLFSAKDETLKEGSLYFDSSSAVRTWFQIPSITVGNESATSVEESIKNGVSMTVWKHPFSKRIWTIPGRTFKYEDAIDFVITWHRERTIDFDRVTEEHDTKDVQSVVKYGFTYDGKMEIFDIVEYHVEGLMIELVLSVPGRYTPLFPL